MRAQVPYPITNRLRSNHHDEFTGGGFRGPFEARYVAFPETLTGLRPSLHRYCARMTGSNRRVAPQMMVFAPYCENAMIGGNAFGSPYPQVSDDAGTPFAVVVIPVDDKLAVK